MEHMDRVKNKLKRLQKAISGAKRPFILIYGNPDPDALASAWAMKALLDEASVSSSILSCFGVMETIRMPGALHRQLLVYMEVQGGTEPWPEPRLTRVGFLTRLH